MSDPITRETLDDRMRLQAATLGREFDGKVHDLKLEMVSIGGKLDQLLAKSGDEKAHFRWLMSVMLGIAAIIISVSTAIVLQVFWPA